MQLFNKQDTYYVKKLQDIHKPENNRNTSVK